MIPRPTSIEPLEARIAPALALQHPLPDLVAGPGKTGAVIDLSEIFDPAATSPNRTIVEFTTNFDTDANTAGLQAGVIRIELFDDLVPLTVQNFLSYVNSKNTKGDYDGTFFHRAVPGFVLQGGGFNSEGSRGHVTTGLELHNEFDPSRSNLRGTITMAKTGLSPHTATSEFFFNVADNSANLDSQNGGFTVFGSVIQGLDIVDAIVALPTRPVIGNFGAPVQNFTGTAAPTADQLIRITDAKVLPATPGNATGITYSIESISSDLVSGKIIGTALNLKYKPGAVGTVDVVVKAVGPGGVADTVSDTFKVTVQPNLIAGFVSDPLPGFLTAGDATTVRLALSNSGAGIAKGQVDVRFYLAEISTATGDLLAAGAKIQVGEVLDRSISIAGGGTTILAARVQVPTELVSDINKFYRLTAEVEPASGLAAQELFGDDNVALDGSNHQVLNQFGAFNTRTKVPLTYVESDGDRVTFSLTGGGFGRLTPDGAGGTDLVVFNTTALSKLSARVTKGAGGDGRIELNDINFTSVLNSAALGLADVDGSVAASGGLRSLQLGDLTGPEALVIGAFLPANETSATIRLGRVSDFDFESAMPVASLTATEWIDTDGAVDVINFLTLGKFNITGAKGVARGDLEALVQVFGSARVASFNVVGFMIDSSFVTSGDIGAITLGGMSNSGIGAGALIPTYVDGQVSDRDIGSFRIRGIAGFTGDLFIRSTVFADDFGSIVVQKVSPDGATLRGFVADAIKSYNRIGGPKLSNLDDPYAFPPYGEADTVGSYIVQVV